CRFHTTAWQFLRMARALHTVADVTRYLIIRSFLLSRATGRGGTSGERRREYSVRRWRKPITASAALSGTKCLLAKRPRRKSILGCLMTPSARFVNLGWRSKVH